MSEQGMINGKDVRFFKTY
jgi:hypothetical protein